MFFFFFILPLLTLFTLLPTPSCGVRGSADQIIRDLYQLPVCGINCTLGVLVDTGCSLTNATQIAACLCTNLEAENTIASCLFANCNYTQTLETEKIQYNLCYDEPKPSRQGNLLGASISMTALVVIFVAARCWSRYAVSKQFWWDDWVLLGSTICFLALQGCIIWGVQMGSGLHVWNANPDMNIGLYTYFWIYEVLYIFVSWTTKSSALALYSRIFDQKLIRRAVYVGYGWLAGHAIVFFFLIIFQCTPISETWDKSLGGKCRDLKPLILSAAVLTIVEDVFIIVLPIPSLLKLSLSWKRKLGVVLVMSVGMIAVVSSMIRLKFGIDFYYSIDIIWNNFGIVVLSTVELSLSIICVCVPAIRLLLKHCFRDYVRSSRRNSPPAPIHLSSFIVESTSMGSSQGVQPKSSSTGRSNTATSEQEEDQRAQYLRPVISLPT